MVLERSLADRSMLTAGGVQFVVGCVLEGEQSIVGIGHGQEDLVELALGRLTADQRDERDPYVSLQRDDVRIGAVRRAVPDARAARLPHASVELVLVLEVDDVIAERDRVITAGWPLAEDLQDRPWGLTDFRILDPGGYYLRITDRAA
jgi:hypothetical protein